VAPSSVATGDDVHVPAGARKDMTILYSAAEK
jgi:hypothetical protein